MIILELPIPTKRDIFVAACIIVPMITIMLYYTEQQTSVKDSTIEQLKQGIIVKDSTIEQLNVRINNLLNYYEERQLQECSNISNTIKIKIISPEKDDKVRGYFPVRGIICGELPDGQYMWIVTNTESILGSWWPQAGPVKPRNGKWSVETWLSLDEKNKGKNNSIAVILVDKNTSDNFINYQKEGTKTGKYPGIPLPADATIIDSISVTNI